MKKSTGDSGSTFEILGGIEGVRNLADAFYHVMSTLPEAANIRNMHPADLAPTCDRFTYFLCGWLGGPSLYKEKIGPPDLTSLHALFKIGEAEKNMWLRCMELALEKQQIDGELKDHLLARFRQPAEKITNWCQQQLVPSVNISIKPRK